MHHIFYFSGTGNTWRIANMLEDALHSLNQKISLRSIEEDIEFSEIKAGDHLILGFPVYGSDTPYPMRNFINSLPIGKENPVSIFACQALASGDTGFYICTKLKEKGYIPHSTIHFKTPNNIHIPDFRFSKPVSTDKADKALEKQKPYVMKFAKEILSSKKTIRGNCSIAHLLGGVQRKYLDSMIEKAGKQLISLDNRCTQCNICTKICPTSNITHSDGKYIFGNNCALCMRCYNLCAANAICFGEKNSDIKKYPRYRGPGGFRMFCLKHK